MPLVVQLLMQLQGHLAVVVVPAGPAFKPAYMAAC